MKTVTADEGTSHGKKLCKHCKRDVSIRNPSGFCDHLYYPNYCDICNGKREDWEKRLFKIIDKFFTVDGKEKHLSVFENDLKDFIRSLLTHQREEMIAQLKQDIGMLRQWLNEDRITDSNRMVTNKEIAMWISTLGERKKR
jgi:hypothetical protein